jgi:hypothetical protein
MSGLPPISAGYLIPFLREGLKLAQGAGKGNPLVGKALTIAEQLIEAHGPNTPAVLVPMKQQISDSLASDFEAMGAAFGRAQEAGKFRG